MRGDRRSTWVYTLASPAWVDTLNGALWPTDHPVVQSIHRHHIPPCAPHQLQTPCLLPGARSSRLIPRGRTSIPNSELYFRCGLSRAHCVKRVSCVVMNIVRSVSGHVSLTRYLKPTPLDSIRITRLHRYYGRLRLPIASAPFLAG